MASQRATSLYPFGRGAALVLSPAAGAFVPSSVAGKGCPSIPSPLAGQGQGGGYFAHARESYGRPEMGRRSEAARAAPLDLRDQAAMNSFQRWIM